MEGIHKVIVQVAPRGAPSTVSHMTIVVPVDGATKKVQTTTKKQVPVYGVNSCGKTVVTGYKEEVTVTEDIVPLKTEITYEGYSVSQVLAPRDFSPEAGGVTREFTFEIYPDSESPFGDGGAPRND
jgi:acetolactate synthase small subunit